MSFASPNVKVKVQFLFVLNYSEEAGRKLAFILLQQSEGFMVFLLASLKPVIVLHVILCIFLHLVLDKTVLILFLPAYFIFIIQGKKVIFCFCLPVLIQDKKFYVLFLEIFQ